MVTASQESAEDLATLPDMAIPKKEPFSPDRLKEIRKQQRMTQEDLAEEAGISVHTVFALEKNKIYASEDTLRKLGQALNVIFTADWTQERPLPTSRQGDKDKGRKDSKTDGPKSEG
jgi:transcriptional regulator with XRE-family HTH domain